MEGSDGELVERAKTGNRDAWNALVSRHSGRLWAVARFSGLSRERAEDVVQTVWLQLLDNVDRIREPDAVGGWLRTVARNEAIRVARDEERTARPGNDAVFDRAAAGPGPEDRVVADDDRARLARAFAKLRPADQGCLRYFFNSEDLSYKEIAAELGRPVGSLGPTRARSLRKLKELFDEEPGTIGPGKGSSPHDE